MINNMKIIMGLIKMIMRKNKSKFQKMKIPIFNNHKSTCQKKNQTLKTNKLNFNNQMMIVTYTIFILKKQDFR